jgi:Acyl-CoA synthetase (NDP forming)
VVSECAEAGVKGAVIISAGFRECGAVGVQLEEAILARRGDMRLIGPNCLGVMIPRQSLNATFAKTMARPGNVAFISQSGALCTSILDWSLREKVGFSAFLSVGSMLDVGWGDLIFYLADDLDTRSILIYMESIGDARAFLSAAREVALRNRSSRSRLDAPKLQRTPSRLTLGHLPLATMYLRLRFVGSEFCVSARFRICSTWPKS